MSRINQTITLTSDHHYGRRLPPQALGQQRVRVVGTLDMLRASTQKFALRLDDGQEVRGVLVSGSIVDAAARMNSRALVLG